MVILRALGLGAAEQLCKCRVVKTDATGRFTANGLAYSHHWSLHVASNGFILDEGPVGVHLDDAPREWAVKKVYGVRLQFMFPDRLPVPGYFGQHSSCLIRSAAEGLAPLRGDVDLLGSDAFSCMDSDEMCSEFYWVSNDAADERVTIESRIHGEVPTAGDFDVSVVVGRIFPGLLPTQEIQIDSLGTKVGSVDVQALGACWAIASVSDGRRPRLRLVDPGGNASTYRLRFGADGLAQIKGVPQGAYDASFLIVGNSYKLEPSLLAVGEEPSMCILDASSFGAVEFALTSDGRESLYAGRFAAIFGEMGDNAEGQLVLTGDSVSMNSGLYVLGFLDPGELHNAVVTPEMSRSERVGSFSVESGKVTLQSSDVVR